MYINHYRTQCYAVGVFLCLQSRGAPSDEWRLSYTPIEGFDYEWGYTYKIRIRVEPIADPPADAPSERHTLLEVIEKQQTSPDVRFDVRINASGEFMKKTSATTYAMHDDKEVTCSPSDCAYIDYAIAQNYGVLFEANHQTLAMDPLLITQIKCSAAMDSFLESCL